MGISDKLHVEGGGVDSEGQKWVIAGISVRAPLRQISTKKPLGREVETEREEGSSTTPTGEDARIPERLPCPPAPTKRRASSKCQFNGDRKFFSPPDLESVFIRRVVERAK